jgi:hypothetical protein
LANYRLSRGFAVAGTNVVIDASSERYVADFIQQSVRASSFSI